MAWGEPTSPAEAEALARTLAEVRSLLITGLAADGYGLRDAAERVVGEIETTPGMRLRVALASAGGVGCPD